MKSNRFADRLKLGSSRRNEVNGSILGTVSSMVLLVLLVLVGLTYLVWQGLGRPAVEPTRSLTINNQIDVLKVSLSATAGLGAIVALVVAYRRQRVTEEENLRARKTARLADEKHFSDRFASASDQLGSEEPATRLAGLYALTALTDTAPSPPLSQSCVEVLCAYVRMPYDATEGEKYWRRGEGEVRNSVIAQIRRHLQNGADPSWQGREFLLRRAVLDNLLLSGAELQERTDLDFTEATFSGRNQLQRIKVLDKAHLNLWGCAIHGGGLEFMGCEFHSGSTAWFRDLGLHGGYVNFDTTTYSGPGGVNEEKAETVFSGVTLDFSNLVMTAGCLSFRETVFKDTRIFLIGAKVTGESLITFDDAKFTGECSIVLSGEFLAGSLSFRRISSSNGLINRDDAQFAEDFVLDFESDSVFER